MDTAKVCVTLIYNSSTLGRLLDLITSFLPKVDWVFDGKVTEFV